MTSFIIVFVKSLKSFHPGVSNISKIYSFPLFLIFFVVENVDDVDIIFSLNLSLKYLLINDDFPTPDSPKNKTLIFSVIYENQKFYLFNQISIRFKKV